MGCFLVDVSLFWLISRGTCCSFSFFGFFSISVTALPPRCHLRYLTSDPFSHALSLVTKQQDPRTGAYSLLFQIDYPEIGEGVLPRHRFMSPFEQRIEAPDREFQYLLFAAEPYETISFKLPNKEVDRTEGMLWSRWDPERKSFFLQFNFRPDRTAPTGFVSRGGHAPAANPLNPFQA